MGESATDAGPPRRTWRTLPRDLLLGAGLGLGIALFWLVVLLLTQPPKTRWVWSSDRTGLHRGDYPVEEFRPWEILQGCLLVLGFVLVVVGGMAVGNLVGGSGGALVGGLAAYLVPFVGYGVYVQRTVGAAAWLDAVGR